MRKAICQPLKNCPEGCSFTLKLQKIARHPKQYKIQIVRSSIRTYNHQDKIGRWGYFTGSPVNRQRAKPSVAKNQKTKKPPLTARHMVHTYNSGTYQPTWCEQKKSTETAQTHTGDEARIHREACTLALQACYSTALLLKPRGDKGWCQYTLSLKEQPETRFLHSITPGGRTVGWYPSLHP